MTERLSDNRFSEILEHYKIITEKIENAKIKAGRNDPVRLMGVTKTVDPGYVNYSVKLGVGLLGENRVQEFLDKRDKYEGNPEIHFIGALQSNKVKYIIDKVSMIHSVDGIKLAQEIDKRARNKGIVMDALIEVNIGGEESKSGINPDMLDGFIYEVAELGAIRIRGLMTIPPPDIDGSVVKHFEKMQRLFEDYKAKTSDDGRFLFDTLSMGMSGDYERAIEFGSNIVRVGSLLYGYRKY